MCLVLESCTLGFIGTNENLVIKFRLQDLLVLCILEYIGPEAKISCSGSLGHLRGVRRNCCI
jgi:hypothetical protein